jgi:hypothetical protein
VKIRFTATHAGSPDKDAWEETHETDAPGPPEEIIGAVIRRFNETLRPGEKARRLVRIISNEATAPKPFVLHHKWGKQNLVTISDRHGMYDKMKCSVCGAMGKRFGLGSVTPDKKFSRICKGYDL